jgi:hypothetical protein
MEAPTESTFGMMYQGLLRVFLFVRSGGSAERCTVQKLGGLGAGAGRTRQSLLEGGEEVWQCAVLRSPRKQTISTNVRAMSSTLPAMERRFHLAECLKAFSHPWKAIDQSSALSREGAWLALEPAGPSLLAHLCRAGQCVPLQTFHAAIPSLLTTPLQW